MGSWLPLGMPSLGGVWRSTDLPAFVEPTHGFLHHGQPFRRAYWGRLGGVELGIDAVQEVLTGRVAVGYSHVCAPPADRRGAFASVTGSSRPPSPTGM